ETGPQGLQGVKGERGEKGEKGEPGGPDATTAQKGIVQLSSATDSDDETKAATPKAVKAAMDKADGCLEKAKNGDDIPDKVKFLNTVGAARVYGRDIHTGAGEWTTSEFVAWLKAKGAFDQPYWMMKASLPAVLNKVITDVGPGKLNLGGCAIEVMGKYEAAIVRVTIGEYGATGFINGTVCTCTVYGDTQYFHWRVDYSTKNKPTTASLTVNGWERDEVTGRLRQWGSIEVSEDDGKLMTQHSIRFPVAFPVAALNAQVSAVGDPNVIKMYTLSNPSLVSVTLITVRGCYGKFSWEAIGY
ncbi:phage tail protein, partial [Escherichia coli]|nr:phage tail protein [Escherichia coli]